MKKDVIIAVLATFCLTATLFMASSSLGYDPWADINDDGKIDMKDIGYEAKLFGTSGDPTKNVSVTNWPRQSSVLAWNRSTLGYDEPFGYSMHEASGFSQLHVLLSLGACQDPEYLKLDICGLLQDGLTNRWISAYSANLSASLSSVAVTIPVPSENFGFAAHYYGPDWIQITISFYLTWA